MEQTGYVLESKNGIAKVRVERESSCGGNCVSCKGCPTGAVIVDAKDTIGLSRGDVVTLFEDTKKVIGYAVVGYGLMALLLVVGAVIGYIITKNDVLSLVSAAVFLLLGFLIVKLLFRNVKSEFYIKNRVHSFDDNSIIQETD